MSTGFPASNLFLPPLKLPSSDIPADARGYNVADVGKFLSPERREIRSLRYADERSKREINGEDRARAGLAQDLDVSPVSAYHGPNEA